MSWYSCTGLILSNSSAVVLAVQYFMAEPWMVSIMVNIAMPKNEARDFLILRLVLSVATVVRSWYRTVSASAARPY